MSKWTENQLVQAAIMYYEKGISQKDIGELFNLSKMTISRMLQKALESNIVKIKIKLPFYINRVIGKKIEDKYNLKEEQAIVARNIKNEAISDFLGRIAAFYLGMMNLDNIVIGSGVGKSIGAMVDNLTPIKTKNTYIMQLMGGLAEVSNSNPFIILQELCNKFSAKGTFLTYKATVDDKKTKDKIISSIHNKSIAPNKNSIAIFGIGLLGKGTLLRPGLVRDEEYEEIRGKGAVGDICGHCFNEKGQFIDSRLEDRLISIPIEQFKKFTHRMAIAGGKEKCIAIKGSLLSGLITTIVIDEETALEII